MKCRCGISQIGNMCASRLEPPNETPSAIYVVLTATAATRTEGQSFVQQVYISFDLFL